VVAEVEDVEVSDLAHALRLQRFRVEVDGNTLRLT
jgi:hypothetical protein